MPYLKLTDAEIYYEEFGSGFPVLAFAPGALRSQIAYWQRSPSNPDLKPGWMDPTASLADAFRVIAIDIRNAGRSRGHVGPDDAWGMYGRDHIALLDHLGIERCHTLGGCIGATFCLMLEEMSPGRTQSMTLLQPIGQTKDNQALMVEEYAAIWEPGLRKNNPDIPDEVLRGFGERMFQRPFVYGSSREFAATVNVPALVLPGSDLAHPAEIADDLIRIMPRSEMVKAWKTPYRDYGAAAVRDFFVRNTPR